MIANTILTMPRGLKVHFLGTVSCTRYLWSPFPNLDPSLVGKPSSISRENSAAALLVTMILQTNVRLYFSHQIAGL
jgi:hypothetical protein